VRIAWQPGELPALAGDQHYHEIQYALRCEFTDTTCRTCWSRVAGSVRFRHPGPIVIDTTTLGSITMTDADKGTLRIIPPALSDSAAGLLYVSLLFQPEPGMTLNDFLDDAGLYRAVIGGNAASISMSHREGQANSYTLKMTNGLGGGSFHADVTLRAVKDAFPEDTLLLRGTLFAHVPLRGGESRDSLGSDTTMHPVKVRTYSVFFATANARNEPIERIILRPQGGSAIIAVGPPMDTTQVALTPMLSKDGQSFLLPYAEPMVRGAVTVPVPRGSKIRPIYVTVSGVQGDAVNITYLSISDHGDTMSIGVVTLKDPIDVKLSGDWDPHGTLSMPGGLELRPMYPDPASHTVTLQYATTSILRNATLTVSDLTGRVVDRVFDGATLGQGEQAIVYDTSRLPAGTYFFTLSSGTVSRTRSFRVAR
jgi:hypothetical protein